MGDSTTIVRHVHLNDVVRAIMRSNRADGRFPTRITACRLQVGTWRDQACIWAMRRDSPNFTDIGERLYILGIPVFEGAEDAQAELVWAQPITGEA